MWSKNMLRGIKWHMYKLNVFISLFTNIINSVYAVVSFTKKKQPSILTICDCLEIFKFLMSKSSWFFNLQPVGHSN